jgi:PEP-CTERM motif
MNVRRDAARLGALAAISAAILSAAAPAQAVDVTFSGGVTGTDPLGGSFTAGPNSVTAGPNAFGFATWGETFSNNGAEPVFNSAGAANNGANFATAFIFTYTGSAPNTINTDFDTGLTQIGNPEGQGWTTIFLSPTKVEFVAPPAGSDPAGPSLAPGDQFDVIVGFTHPIEPGSFSFTAQWLGVPEPGTWTLLIGGLGLTGAALRRANRRAATRLA